MCCAELKRWVLAVLSCACSSLVLADTQGPIEISVNWGQSVGTLKTTPTVMVVPNPILRKPSAVRDAAWAALKTLGSERARYLSWVAFPRLAVAELEPPTAKKTFWDFSHMDSVAVPFLEATKGRNPIMSFSTIPAWMFDTPKPVAYSSDPDKMDFAYGAGTELKDLSAKTLGDYHARLVRWYTQGGFVDELGKRHHSGHRYDIQWWGVLNEMEIEHLTTPEQYTRRYDAIVSAVREVNPNAKFMALSLCGMRCDADETAKFFEYFLDSANHASNIPIDMVAYHYYAHLRDGGDIKEWQFSLFDQADSFIHSVQLIESLRKRLRPQTRVNIDELGLRVVAAPGEKAKPIPGIYWNLAAAYDAYLFIELAKRGVDVLTTSHFIGSDDFTPSESMMDWREGKPNARYHAQKLMIDHFDPGDEFVATTLIGPRTKRISQMLQLAQPPQVELFQQREIAAQAIKTRAATKIFIVNKTAEPVQVDLGKIGQAARVDIVDAASGNGAARQEAVKDGALTLGSFAVAVVTELSEDHQK